MRNNKSILSVKLINTALICLSLSACIGTAVGVVVDTAIEVVKIPVKVAGAVVDMAVPDKTEKEDKFHLQLNDTALSDDTALRDETALSKKTSVINIDHNAKSEKPGTDNK